jgi:hypothetical protein
MTKIPLVTQRWTPQSPNLGNVNILTCVFMNVFRERKTKIFKITSCTRCLSVASADRSDTTLWQPRGHVIEEMICPLARLLAKLSYTK